MKFGFMPRGAFLRVPTLYPRFFLCLPLFFHRQRAPLAVDHAYPALRNLVEGMDLPNLRPNVFQIARLFPLVLVY